MGAFPSQDPGSDYPRGGGYPPRYPYDEPAAPAPAAGPVSAPAPADTGLLPAPPDPEQWGHGTFGYWTLAELGTEQVQGARRAGEYASALDKLTSPALTGYSKFLEQMTDPDSAARMAAAGPGVAAITKQQEAARRNIESALPRSGAKDYLTSLSYIQQAGDIGSLLDQAWLQAEEARGKFGEWGVSAAQRNLLLEQSGLAGGVGTTEAAVGMKRETQAANQQAVADLVQTLAAIAFMG